MPWCDLDLTLFLRPLYIKSCPGFILETIRCRKLILGRALVGGCNVMV